MNDLDLAQTAGNARRAIQESEVAEEERRANDLTLTMLRKLLGPDMGPALFNRTLAEKLMQDQAWERRLAGLVILREYCQTDCQGDFQLLDQIMQMSATDSHPQVRGVALRTVGRLLKSSRHPKYGKHLARLVLDPSLSLPIRSSAYLGLCDLHGGQVPIVHEVSELLRRVDDEMLRSYAARTDRETPHQV